MKEPIKNAIIALVLHLGLLAALMFLFDLNIFGSRYRKCSIRSYHVYFQMQDQSAVTVDIIRKFENHFLSLQSPLPVWCCCMARLSWHSVRAAC